MELRSTSKRLECAEYKELQDTLNGMGCLEPDMDLQEMRQLITALHASMAPPPDDGFDESEMFTALEESRIYTSFNSTMVTPTPDDPQNAAAVADANRFSPCGSSSTGSSPVMLAVRFTTHAEVHHEQDWIPPPKLTSPHAGRKRAAAALSEWNGDWQRHRVADDESSMREVAEKRARMEGDGEGDCDGDDEGDGDAEGGWSFRVAAVTPEESADSGVSWSNVSNSNSLHQAVADDDEASD